ncbi:hypothetical protein [Loktanella sp. S4079]|uniref:hypothetical protein n=1 Tax=Loktanella sp. S4079 TaxID=579483 RepID=UPI0005FA25A4|nr:hypothetical protein [Loktanella sp. S4079]KJZ18029.1 hypothetical protein TW80_16190 [Loktanella sp. S4079]
MSDFLRPEVRAFLWRWRDVLIGGALLLCGAWWGARAVGTVGWIGYVIAFIGVVFALAGAQRARFRQQGEGAGVVQINERRLSYFGPLDGGVMDVADLTKLELDPSAHPDPNWVLTGVGGQNLSIPVNAAGAEALFDVFAGLPGIKTTDMLTVLSRTPDARVTIWSRVRPVLH